MNGRQFISLIFITTLLSGCSMANISNSIKGKHYIATGEYQQAEQTFKKAVQKNPENALGHYYLGRFLLAQKKTAEALPHFQQSVALDPDDADYNFWLGVTYGEIGDSVAERSSYERTLELTQLHPQANLYLGHLQLKSGELKLALKSYDLVLKQLPTNASALYNRALILDIQGKNTDARKAWLKYLKWYPAGKQAIQATNNLNALGDFSFENHYIGRRTVTLAEIKFQQPKTSVSRSSYPSLLLIGAIVSNLDKGNLQIVVYENHNKKRAQQKALDLKDTLHKLSPDITSDRIQISWFGSPEIVIEAGKKYSKNQSVRFFLTDWK
jgi:Flp pilus assembly protein TadD